MNEFSKLVKEKSSFLGKSGRLGIESKTIYLSHSFIESHLENPEIVSQVILEELGHFLDVKLETEDAPGDEGEIFASLATGGELAQAQLIALQGESDRVQIHLNGENITVEQNGTGLKGYYYHDADFGKLAYEHIESPADMNWGEAPWAVALDKHSIRWTGLLTAPDTKTYNFTTRADGRTRVWLEDDGGTWTIQGDNWSGIWTAQVEAPSSDTYQFFTRADGKVRLWWRHPDGEWQRLIDAWENDPNTSQLEASSSVFMEAGQKYDIQVEYKDETGDAQLKLLWESPSQTLAAIPPQFFSAEKPETPVGVAGNGTGLKGTYYNNSDFTNLVLERKDGEIDFDWGVGSPDAVMEPDSFSVRWTGEIEPRYTNEDYRFYLQNDDGARLWLDGELIVDNWDNPAPERASQPLSLEAGQKYDIQLEYREEVGTAGVQLLWSSREQEKETIPASQLFGEDPADCAPIAVGWSQTLDIAQPGAYTFDIDLPFGTTFTVNGETFDTTPEDNSFSLLLPAGAIDFQLQMPAISPCAPPWSDTPENEGGPEIELGITFPTGERRRGYIEGGWLTNAGPGGGTGGDDGGWWDIDLPSWEPVDPGTNEPPPASGEEPAGTGLYAQYFKGTTFSNLAYAKFVPNVYEDWDYKGPLWDDSHLEDEVRLNVEADNFGVRYTGQIKAIEDGEYKFSFKELDGKARLWVNGQLVMDGEGHGTPPDANGNGIADDFYYGDVSQSISLEAGQKYNFQLDFVDPGGEASALLHWEKDGGAPATIWNSLLYPTMPPGMLLVNDEPTPVLVGKSSAAASLLSQYFYDDYESVNVTVRDRSPNESAAFLNSPVGDVLWSGTLSKSEVLGTDSYLEIAQKNYEEMFGEDLPERDRLYGTHLAVEYELLDENGAMVTIDNRAPGQFTDNFYVYRWIDAVGEGKAFGLKDAAAVFHEKTDDGVGEFKQEKQIDLFVPSPTQTKLIGKNPSDFEYKFLSDNQVSLTYNSELSSLDADGFIQKPIAIKIDKHNGNNFGQGITIGSLVAVSDFRTFPSWAERIILQAQQQLRNAPYLSDTLKNKLVSQITAAIAAKSQYEATINQANYDDLASKVEALRQTVNAVIASYGPVGATPPLASYPIPESRVVDTDHVNYPLDERTFIDDRLPSPLQLGQIRVTGGFMEADPQHGEKPISPAIFSHSPDQYVSLERARRNHGIDYAVENASNVVKNWYGGFVTSAGTESGYGYRVRMRTPYAFKYQGNYYNLYQGYAHLRSINQDIIAKAASGGYINSRTPIGVMGGSSAAYDGAPVQENAYNVHVDFRLWITLADGTEVDVSPNVFEKQRYDQLVKFEQADLYDKDYYQLPTFNEYRLDQRFARDNQP